MVLWYDANQCQPGMGGGGLGVFCHKLVDGADRCLGFGGRSVTSMHPFTIICRDDVIAWSRKHKINY